jgi:hypothetical protein
MNIDWEITLDKVTIDNPSLEGRGRCYIKGYVEGQLILVEYLIKESRGIYPIEVPDLVYIRNRLREHLSSTLTEKCLKTSPKEYKDYCEGKRPCL